jgi:hypothetical protein
LKKFFVSGCCISIRLLLRRTLVRPYPAWTFEKVYFKVIHYIQPAFSKAHAERANVMHKSFAMYRHFKRPVSNVLISYQNRYSLHVILETEVY